MIEPQYAEVGDYPVWQSSVAPEGYIDRLFPLIKGFSIDVTSFEMTSKLHQHFGDADRKCIAEHLLRANRTDSQLVAKRILETKSLEPS